MKPEIHGQHHHQFKHLGVGGVGLVGGFGSVGGVIVDEVEGQGGEVLLAVNSGFKRLSFYLSLQ